MRSKEEIKEKKLAEFLHLQVVCPSLSEHFQYHIDNIDSVVDELIAHLANMIIDQAIYSYRINNYNENAVFGTTYTSLLGLSLSDLGQFPKDPTTENIDKFITFINKTYDINMPTKAEYNYVKNSDFKDEELDDIKRRNGEKINPSGRYSEDILNNDSISKKVI